MWCVQQVRDVWSASNMFAQRHTNEGAKHADSIFQAAVWHT